MTSHNSLLFGSPASQAMLAAAPISAALPPLVVAIGAAVPDSEIKRWKRLRQVHTLYLDILAGDVGLRFEGGLGPKKEDATRMREAALDWVRRFESAAGVKLHDTMIHAPWCDPVVVDEVSVHYLRSLAATALTSQIAADWTDNEPRDLRFLFQVLREGASHYQTPSDTWLTKDGLFWHTPTSKHGADAVTNALRAWLTGPGRSLFAHVCNTSFSIRVEQTVMDSGLTS